MSRGLYTDPKVEKRRRAAVMMAKGPTHASELLGDITPEGIYMWAQRRGLAFEGLGADANIKPWKRGPRKPTQ